MSPLVHIDIGIDTILLLVGFVDDVEEQVNSKVFSISEASFFSLSLGYLPLV
jgi:hypothetical protein